MLQKTKTSYSTTEVVPQWKTIVFPQPVKHVPFKKPWEMGFVSGHDFSRAANGVNE